MSAFNVAVKSVPITVACFKSSVPTPVFSIPIPNVDILVPSSVNAVITSHLKDVIIALSGISNEPISPIVPVVVCCE